MDAEQRMEQQPPLPVRMLGKGLVRLVATRPALWPLLRGPTRRFFDGAAAGWDGRVDPDSPEHLAPLEAALGVLPGPPAAVSRSEPGPARAP